jgi:uncharacterized protein (TIRG00374 family)
MDGDRWVTVVGFAAALLVLAILVYVAGVEETIGTLQQADPGLSAVVLGLAVVWLSAWGLSLHTVLGAMDAPLSATRSILVFSAAMFANNITPFGQAGGEPVSAFLISEATDAEYETGLAAIASVDTLHFVPSIGIAVVGVASLLLRSVPLGRQFVVAIVAIVVLVAVFVAAVVLGYRYRHRIEHIVGRALTPIVQGLYRLIPTRSPPDPAAIQGRVDGFFSAIDRIAADRQAIVLASAFSAAGWLALSTALWVAVLAVGVDVPLAAALVVTPIGSIAGVTPLPGGSGAVEGAFAALLTSLGGISSGAAVAAVFIHRVATYWLPTFVGGGVATALGARHATIDEE